MFQQTLLDSGFQDDYLQKFQGFMKLQEMTFSFRRKLYF